MPIDGTRRHSMMVSAIDGVIDSRRELRTPKSKNRPGLPSRENRRANGLSGPLGSQSNGYKSQSLTTHAVSDAISSPP